MMPSTTRPKLDLSQLGKRILDEATGDAPKTKPPPVKVKRPAAKKPVKPAHPAK